MAEIPLFPLKTVLLPCNTLTLKIFEARYIDMIASCMREDGVFGVVLIHRGEETGSDADIYSVGTTARITSRREVHRKRPEIYQFTSSSVTNNPSGLVNKLMLAKDRVRSIDVDIRGRILDIYPRRNFGIVEVLNDGADGGPRFRYVLYEEGRDAPHVLGPV